MTIREILLNKAAAFSERGIPSSKLEVEVLLRHVLDIDRAEFFASLNRELTPSQIRRLTEFSQRRLNREPLAYIVGHREFYGLDFTVNEHVLIPRQETELLVERALNFASAKPHEHLCIADVGTGSGAIAIAISYNLPGAAIYALDNSGEALSVAKANAERHGVSDRIQFLHSDLLDSLPNRVDVVVSNPPYLKSSDIPKLEPEIRKEPAAALDGGRDGLDVIRRLLRQAPQRVKPTGCVLIETSHDQTGDVRKLAQGAFPGSQVSVYKDLLNLPRVVQISLDHCQA